MNVPRHPLAHAARSLLYGLLLAIPAVGPAHADGMYLAEIRSTSFGIHHVKAGDWGSLGFGYGYAYAGDNLCILARETIAARGELARYFGDSGSNVKSDFFYRWVNTDAFAQAFVEGLRPDLRDLARGYAAGYNRYLREVGVDNLAEDCRGAEWVNPLTELDLLKVFYKLILRASSGALLELIVDAEPPAASRAVDPAEARRIRDALIRDLVPGDLESLRPRQRLGSNMYALGGNATQSGRGMVLGNPHFDWEGPLRWYQIHLTIPGTVDVMGASLQGVPLVNIGFTENFAWSHTVSPADRFTLFELSLVPGQPTRYLYDGAELDMTSTTVSIEVLEGDELVTREHTFYESVFGPVLDFQALGLPLWSTGIGVFTVRDANAPNLRAVEQFFRMNIAQSLDEFVAVLKEEVGLPWVHTVAAGPNGDAFYGDISSVPNVSADKVAACPPVFFGQTIIDFTGLIVLDGTRSACDWDVDRSSPQEGIIGGPNLPSLETRDYVTNSNDNHWLSNPDQPLEGFPPALRAERTQRSLRTRLGLLQVQERLAGTDGLGAPGFTLETLQQVMYGSRNYAAEMLRDELVALCEEAGPTVDVGGEPVDVSESCTALAGWDTRQDNDSTGPQVFLEFLESAAEGLNDGSLAGLFEVPFDPDDPVNTPNMLSQDPARRDEIMLWLAQGVQRLQDAGIATDAPWGTLQFTERNGVRIPVHGGRDGSGMFSIITADLVPGVGYTPIEHGNSYMQTVTWDEDGVVADAMLTYSQSSDPESPHYADQTAVYSEKGWVRLPFTDEEIRADPNLVTKRIRERRRDVAEDPRRD